jgi:hypothetical protein
MPCDFNQPNASQSRRDLRLRWLEACAPQYVVITMEDNFGALEEVVPTARRQEKELEKVPMTVAALSTSALAYGDVPRNTGSLYLRVARDLPHSVHQRVTRQDICAQSNFYYSNLAASLNVPPNGIGPRDPNTRIDGYTLLKVWVEWNDIAGSAIHVTAYVRNLLEGGARGGARVLICTVNPIDGTVLMMERLR